MSKINIRHVDLSGRDITQEVKIKYGMVICPICGEKFNVKDA